MVCSRLTWAFTTASGYALHCIPEGYDNIREINEVVEVANFRKIKGVTVKLQKRVLQKKAARTSVAMRKLYKKAGRLETISRAFLRNRVDAEVNNLMKKVFPHYDFSDISRSMVREELDKTKICISKREADDKDCNIKSWKRRMQSGLPQRGLWINKQGQMKSPMVFAEQCAENRQDGAKKLHHYWKQLWDSQDWTEEERISKAALIADLIHEKVLGSFEGERPSLQEFQCGLKRISGTHGIDGWASSELKAGAEMVWNAMELWEDSSLLPDCVAHCKLVCVPKKDKRMLSPNEYRPVCVMSSLWRVWSTTWIRSSSISKWTRSLFPATVSGGLPGSYGAETLAAMVDHQVHRLHHGVSLDFKHAFDTVDLGLMHYALRSSMAKCMFQWLDLVFKQWMSMSRWLIFDGCTHQQAMVTKTGLPQGDPASPLIMNILMWYCMTEVNKVCDDPSIFHVTYMDDRTIAASSPQVIQQAEWNRLASEFHLLENRGKAQHINVENYETMEVLGALIGRPLPIEEKSSKATKRLEASASRYRRISFLPLKHKQKLLTANVFARSGLEYGWIASNPTDKQLKSQEVWLWQCLGRTKYSSPFLRNVMVGANSHLRFMLLKRQLRVLAKRDLALQKLGIEVGRTPLNQLVEDSLNSLGWVCIEQFWTHPFLERGFKIMEMNDEVLWRKVCHYIRESYCKVAFDDLVQCGRHDANEINVPYDAGRRQLALRWAGDDFTSFLLTIGGMASPYQRRMFGYGEEGACCSVCGEEAPGWEHIWQCAVGFIPVDGLLKRFLWPRTQNDFPICSAFHKTFKWLRAADLVLSFAEMVCSTSVLPTTKRLSPPPEEHEGY